MTRSLPTGVAGGSYILKPPLGKKSMLTSLDKGGVGKELSDGWVANFAIGCTFGCGFCYVDPIHKRWGSRRVGDIVKKDWGYYFAVPENLQEVIEKTNWANWNGKEVMLSSTHDAYLPQLYKWTRKILEKALPAGVKFCIQTRSPLVEQDFKLISRYRDQVRLQVSVATMNAEFSRKIELRVVPPLRRLDILRNAKNYVKCETGIIIAPIFPRTQMRPDIDADLHELARHLAGIRPEHIYGESLHRRGVNMTYIEKALGERVLIDDFDAEAKTLFNASLKEFGLGGRWWDEE